MTSLTLYTKLEMLPPHLRLEVSDFVDFLILKSSEKKKGVVPQFGCAKGQIYLSEDFDEPLEDLKDYM